MGRGRPPTPTALKLVRGNPGRRRLNEHEPTPPAGSAKAPNWLRGRGRRAWGWIAPDLEGMGVLTRVDVQAVALLCDALGEYIDCRDVVRRLGAVYESRILKASSRAVGDEVDEELEGQPHGGALKRRRVQEDDFSPEDWSVIIRPRPEVRMATDAWRRSQRMMVEFGMTASARAKVQRQASDEVDPFESFLGGSSASRGA